MIKIIRPELFLILFDDIYYQSMIYVIEVSQNQIYIKRNKSVVLSSVLKTEINFYGCSLLCLKENSLRLRYAFLIVFATQNEPNQAKFSLNRI